MSKDIEMYHMFYFIVLNYGLQLQNCSRIGFVHILFQYQSLQNHNHDQNIDLEL
jgi:hypothetical protein